jgi:pimeloyl-ACP methyl ester carboxylesterase
MTALRALRHETGAPDLMVLLPGAHMQPEDYAQAGCFDAVTRRGLALDVVAVDLGAEAASGSAPLAALQAQILGPARQRYRRVWLGGISLGGLLALAHATDTPAAVDGLCLLAPYPGSRLTTNAIERAGGLDAWQPTPEQLADPEFRVWRWLKQPPADLPVFAGYGTEDRFAGGMRRLAERFPPAARCAIPGGHDWPVWQQLWAHFLDLGHFSA